MSSASDINNLLNDKLFQVIGSTPGSIAESLMKSDFKGKKTEAAQMFAVCIFAAAVNKATLETFMSDSRFASVRPLISATLSISGRANMTAMTLLGHCFLTTDVASTVVFASEFRKKMGQNHLWAGELMAGSLSDKQRDIMKEKKRVTVESEAKALGNGFLKIAGIMRGSLTEEEQALFKGVSISSGESMRSSSGQPESSTRSPAAGRTAPSAAAAARASASSSAQRARASSGEASDPEVPLENFTTVSSDVIPIPADVLAYRRDVLGQSEERIADSISRKGVDDFVRQTRILMKRNQGGNQSSADTTVG